VTTAEHGKHHRLVPDEYVRRRYEEGASFPQISAETGFAPAVLSQALRRAGGVARSPAAWKIVPVDEQKLRLLHGRPGMRVPQIARELGVGEQVVRLRMKEWGLSPFPVGAPPRG
jgi:hypothetical protein